MLKINVILVYIFYINVNCDFILEDLCLDVFNVGVLNVVMYILKIFFDFMVVLECVFWVLVCLLKCS